MRKHILTGIVALAAVAAGVAIPASAASAPVTTPSNTVPTPVTRIVNVPGIRLTNNQTTTLTVAGRTFGGIAIPANATGIEGTLTAYQDTGNSRLVVWDGVSGAPGTPTVSGTRTTPNGSGPSSAFHVALSNGTLKVHNAGAAVQFLLTMSAYDIPAPAPTAPPAPTFGVAQLQVDGTTWAQYETAELGAPGGDQASGTVRFTCRNAAAGCDVSLKGYSTASGWTVYPRIVLEKEDNTNGAKLTCEYADGADNNGATQALTGTPATVEMGIGSTADCGSTVQTTVSGPVDHVNVPGSAGQGIHYDAFVTLTFAKSAS